MKNNNEHHYIRERCRDAAQSLPSPRACRARAPLATILMILTRYARLMLSLFATRYAPPPYDAARCRARLDDDARSAIFRCCCYCLLLPLTLRRRLLCRCARCGYARRRSADDALRRAQARAARAASAACSLRYDAWRLYAVLKHVRRYRYYMRAAYATSATTLFCR